MDPRPAPPRPSRARRAGDVVVGTAFSAAILAVALGTAFAPARPASLEREFRRPAPPPSRPTSVEDLRAWPAKFDPWFRDHFALRPLLIRWHNLVKIELFGISPTSEIVLGPDRWMFTTRDRAVDVFRGADPFTERELDLWTRILEDRRQWCAERGIAYVFAIAPNKESIYPDRFPARFDKIGPSRREQLVAHVAARSDFPLADLTGALRRARDEQEPHDVFYPLGTHWNDRGAVHAYRALLERVAEHVPGVAPRPLEQFRFVATDVQDDSWAGRLYLEDRLRQDNAEFELERTIPAEAWKRLDAFLKRRDKSPEEARRFEIAPAAPEEGWRIVVEDSIHVTVERAPARGTIPELSPKAVIFHDSMGEKLRPLLAEHFRETRFRWVSDFDTALIEREEPDVVVQLFVERALAAFSLSTSPLDTQELCEREFQASTAVAVADAPAFQGRAIAGGAPLVIPEFAPPPASWPILRLEVDAPSESSLLLEFRTRRFRDYSRIARGVQRPLRAGRNVVYVKLRVPDLEGPLRLTFLPAGEYVLRSLEVRAAPE